MEAMHVSLVILRVAVFLSAAYLLWQMYCFNKATRSRVFSKAMGAMVLAVALFVMVEAMQVSGMLTSEAYEPFHLIVLLSFLLLLLYALDGVRKDMLAYEHIIHRKFRRRMPDAE